jgi:phenylalanyl-tRNA synthetase beta subunit
MVLKKMQKWVWMQQNIFNLMRWIYELGITPNRMDAMSHWGVAKDVCAYLNHHDKKI